jgi:hypothetical protein
MEETMIHPETGKILYRDVRPIEYTYKEQRITVDQPGWYPSDKNDNDGILSHEDAKSTDYALDIMKARHQKYLEEQNSELGNLSLA